MKNPLPLHRDPSAQQRRYKALAPVAFFVLVMVMASSAKVAGYVLFVGVFVAIGLDTFMRLYSGRGRLRGAARREFARLLTVLVRHIDDQDIFGMVTVMEKMAVLMETDFFTAHKFLLRNSFNFTVAATTSRHSSLTVATTVAAARIAANPSPQVLDIVALAIAADQCKDAWQVLQKEKRQLSEYLAHPEEHIRKAAVERMKRLQGVSGVIQGKM